MGSRTTHRRSTTARGLGWRHQQRVAALKRELVEGTECFWCGEGLYLDPSRNPDGRTLSGDHTVPRSIGGVHHLADRLVHQQCNTERQDGRNDHLRPALTGKRLPVRTATNEARLGVRIMPWPDMPAPR